jgi:hypothetical protein
MLDFTAFREQEETAILAEKYDISYKIAKNVIEELIERNINKSDIETISSIVRMFNLREEPKSKKQLRTEEKQGNLQYLLNEFKKDKVKKQNIDEKFKLIFNGRGE